MQEVGAVLVIAVLNGAFLRKHYKVVLFNEATTLLTSQFPHIPDCRLFLGGALRYVSQEKERCSGSSTLLLVIPAKVAHF